MDGEQRDSFDYSSVGHLSVDAHDIRAKYTGDPLFLPNSGHPGMTLISSVLTGNNYLS